MLLRAIIGILALSALPACAVPIGDDFLRPVAVVRKLWAERPLCGSHTAPVWSRPVSIRYLPDYRGDGMPTQQTEIRLAYDDANLYVVFRCFEDRMDELATEYTAHDDKIWRDDSVAVLLDPGCKRGGYFYLTANAAGARYEERDKVNTPQSWDGDWSAEVASEAGAWTALITVPFGSMGTAAPKPGTVWGANFGRHEVPRQELSCWSPVSAGFQEPKRFGRIVFSDSDVATVSAPTVGEIKAPGEYPVILTVSSPADGERLRAEALCDGQVISSRELEAAAGTAEYCLDVDFAREGRHLLSIAVADSSGETIMRTPPVPVIIAPHRATLAKYREAVDALQPSSADLRAQKPDVRKLLDEAAAFAETAEGSAAKWNELSEKLEALEPTVSRLRYACADPDERGYVLGSETALRKILRDAYFEGAVGGPVTLSACRNEYESAQAVVIAYDKAMEDVSVSVSPLQGPGGAAIAPERVTLNLVDYVRTRKPRYEVEYVGWWPDPLMPMKPFDVPVGRIQPIWVTVHPSGDAPAGIYRGHVVVKPSNAPESRLPVEVRVWDFALPRELRVKTAFALFESEIRAWYGDITEEMRRDYYEFMLEHRLNPTNIYTKSPVPAKDDLPFCVERGLNAFCLAYTHNKSEKGRAELLETLKDYEAYLKAKGWWDKAYIYGFDEIRPEKYGELRDMYGWLEEHLPDLPRMCTVVPNEDLKGYVDIWVPLTANYDWEDAVQFTGAGGEVWWYVCCTPLHPYPNFFVDYPAIDPRIVFWMNWKYRVPGFLYYAVNLWATNRAVGGLPENRRPHEDPAVREAIKAGKRWPEVPWNTFTFSDFNGDGHLIYPGPRGKPLSSIRLECIRDGIEDCEYFHILNELVAKAGSNADPALLAKANELLAVKEEVVKSLTTYTDDPDVLLAARRDVAEMIERLGGARTKGGVGGAGSGPRGTSRD